MRQAANAVKRAFPDIEMKASSSSRRHQPTVSTATTRSGSTYRKEANKGTKGTSKKASVPHAHATLSDDEIHSAGAFTELDEAMQEAAAASLRHRLRRTKKKSNVKMPVLNLTVISCISIAFRVPNSHVMINSDH